MEGTALFDDLKRKLGFKTQHDVAKFLGITSMALHKWRNGNALTARQIANALVSTREAAVSDAQQQMIKGIVEFFQIDATEIGTKGKYAVFPTGKDAGQHCAGLKKCLEDAKGIYIFYDTRGKALYAGQTQRQNLWKEVNNAFNRERSAQTITLVRHPTNDVVFKPASGKIRQPTDINLKLHDLAAYFSAFEVTGAMVNELEALLVRAFPNDLLNFKMEKLGKIANKKKAKAGTTTRRK